MITYIALLRGINVGGRNKLPMKELKNVLAQLGLQNIKTYIQSGNVIFDSDTAERDTLAQQITEGINNSHGFAPRIMILTLDELETAVAQNPYPQATAEPKTLHLYFLATEAPHPNWAKLEERRSKNEQFTLIDKVFYLHAPDGIGRSKLAEQIEKALGVPTTARNWRSVTKILDLVQ